MEKRVVGARMVPINPKKPRGSSKSSALSRFWRRHPYLYSIVVTIAAFAVISIAVALIQDVLHSPVPPPPVPPVPVVTYTSPAPSPAPIHTSNDNSLSEGDCAAGDFSSSDPSAVQKVLCSSSGAYEVLDTFDGNDESACEEVKGAEFAYIQEVQELTDGAVVSTTYTTLCMGRP